MDYRQLDNLTPDELRQDIRYVQGLIRKAEAEGSADALAAKNLFLQLIARLKREVAEAEKVQVAS
ncbi:hypothetical protein [Thiohalomonas denitrificans]|uniref:Uncharacterized protein n=1 Tax=Thiohalomonas denitrificans TaxID=415747 RepID=A0A1G5PW31_9GAMM|nr:hypothetical protein [Thiohalomonas denitrificans]SCZ53617.1 hypothetical protein SAMN03097708_00964 [Thiohalomonas denitrificans]